MNNIFGVIKIKNKQNILKTIVIVAIFLIFITIIGSKNNSNNLPNLNPIEAIEISSRELVSAYDQNEISADQKYKNKLLKIKGTVQNLGKDITDTAYVTLTGDGVMHGVQCFFDDKDLVMLSKINKGQKVTIQGKCQGLMMNVLIEKSKVL